MIQYSYDVFSFDGDRWSLERTYSTTQSDDAFQFARRLYAAPHIKGVRIIQELFDSEEGGVGRKPMLTRLKDTNGTASNNGSELGRAGSWTGAAQARPVTAT